MRSSPSSSLLPNDLRPKTTLNRHLPHESSAKRSPCCDTTAPLAGNDRYSITATSLNVALTERGQNNTLKHGRAEGMHIQRVCPKGHRYNAL
jgi:hypothetical protein